MENFIRELSASEQKRLENMRIYKELNAAMNELVRGVSEDKRRDRLVSILMSAAGNYGMHKELARLVEITQLPDGHRTLGDVVEMGLLSFRMMMCEVINTLTVQKEKHDIDIQELRAETQRIIEETEQELKKIREEEGE